MNEVDIWIKVFELKGYTFIDEVVSRKSNNYLIYKTKDNVYIRLYFNFDTGYVSHLSIHGLITEAKITYKKDFFEKNKDIFRMVKIESFIN